MLERLIFADEDGASTGVSSSRSLFADNSSTFRLETVGIFDGGDIMISEDSSTRFLLADGPSELELTRLE
jgi:hypothetical protein